MRGLVFDLFIPKYVLAKAIGKQVPSVHYGAGSCLSLREVESPKVPGPGWIRLRPVLAGLCGSDISTFFFKTSPQLEPFNSFPAVLGHEVLAEVLEVPDGVTGFEVGEKVAVNPLLPCRLREIVPPCRHCAAGNEYGCENAAEGCLAPGQMLGYHRDLPGGMGTEMVAHVSQLHPIGPKVSDKAGVLFEPLSVSLHAVLRHPPKDGDRVLIIGGGPVAFAALWALKATGSKAHVTLMTLEQHQLDFAKSFGVDDVMKAAPTVPEIEEVAKRTGGKVYKPIIGPPVMTGGFDHVIDCVGTAASVQDALRYTRAFGTVVLIGAAGILKSVDWTSVWRNELSIFGSYVYGPETFRGRRQHTFDVVRDLVSAGEGPDPSSLVTHVFPLTDYKKAIEANLRRGSSRAIKTAFDPRATNG